MFEVKSMKRRTDKHNYISYEIIMKFVVVNIMLRTVNGRKKKSLKEISVEGKMILKTISERMTGFGKG